jgi:hypothetical protein
MPTFYFPIQKQKIKSELPWQWVHKTTLVKTSFKIAEGLVLKWALLGTANNIIFHTIQILKIVLKDFNRECSKVPQRGTINIAIAMWMSML